MIGSIFAHMFDRVSEGRAAVWTKWTTLRPERPASPHRDRPHARTTSRDPLVHDHQVVTVVEAASGEVLRELTINPDPITNRRNDEGPNPQKQVRALPMS